jgi:prepilin-type N-terminal cleavage/methylation domain-containing protein
MIYHESSIRFTPRGIALMPKRRNGFTLIELLVVVAIIAILAAILFPVFTRARERANYIKCLSNLKQCAVAIQMYVQANGRYPKGGGEIIGFFQNSKTTTDVTFK